MSITLVLLPGMDGTGELFGPFIDALGPAQPVQVLRYPTDRPWGYTELLPWAAQQLPAGAPYVLLGESFGGPLAWRLAAGAHGHLKGLVLCCTFARNPLPLLAPLAAVCHALPWQTARARWLEWLMLGHAASAQLRQRFRTAIAQVPPAVLSARARAVLTLPPQPPRLSPQLPVLSLRARGDRVVPRAATEGMAQGLPHAQTAVLPGPHGLLQRQPAAAAAQVRAFLRSLALPG